MKKEKKDFILVSLIMAVLLIALIFSNYFSNVLGVLSTAPSKELTNSALLTNFLGKIVGALIENPVDSEDAPEEGDDGEGEGGSEGDSAPSGEEHDNQPAGTANPVGTSSGNDKELIKEPNDKDNMHYACNDQGYCVPFSGEEKDQCSTDSFCINLAKEDLICKDTDSDENYIYGNNPFEKGAVKSGEESEIDNCQPLTKTLQEWHCNSGDEYTITSTTYDCTQFGNYRCYNGACILEEDIVSCEDSDDKDYSVQGTISFSGKTKTDECVGISTLIEYFCDQQNEPNFEIKTCEGPVGVETCKGGKCIYPQT